MSILRRRSLLLLPVVLATCGGCQLIAFPFIAWGKEPTREVKAEYPYLRDKHVAVLVRAEMETLVEYPHVQYELADHIQVALEASVRGVTVVDPRKVVDFQRKNADWDRMDPAALGKDFDADRLVEIQLTQYTTRDPENPYLFRGHVAAVVNVYNVDYPNSAPAYTTDVRVAYPPNETANYGTDERDVRRAMMEAFAQEVAGKFYDREVKVK